VIIPAVVEIPKGSRAKFEWKNGRWKLSRFTHEDYPAAYGFIPGTMADDGDALDVLILSSRPLSTTDVTRVRPIGILRMIDRGYRDNKVLAVDVDDPKWGWVKDLETIPESFTRHVSRFYHAMGKRDVSGGWHPRIAAERVVVELSKANA